MSKYKVTKKDLIGDIKGFPIEVVEKMLEYQVKQGNKENIKVFQKNASAGALTGGFTWSDTIEKSLFWDDVILIKKFDVFFDKYPKNHYVYIYQDGTKKCSDVIETLVRRGGNNRDMLVGSGIKVYYYIHPVTKVIECARHKADIAPWVKTFYTKIDVEPSIKEYTMQEIADKLGINVNELRIKK